MRVLLIISGAWLLANLLFVLIVIPPRKAGSPTSPVGRTINFIRNVFKKLRS